MCHHEKKKKNPETTTSEKVQVQHISEIHHLVGGLLISHIQTRITKATY